MSPHATEQSSMAVAGSSEDVLGDLIENIEQPSGTDVENFKNLYGFMTDEVLEKHRNLMKRLNFSDKRDTATRKMCIENEIERRRNADVLESGKLKSERWKDQVPPPLLPHCPASKNTFLHRYESVSLTDWRYEELFLRSSSSQCPKYAS